MREKTELIALSSAVIPVCFADGTRPPVGRSAISFLMFFEEGCAVPATWGDSSTSASSFFLNLGVQFQSLNGKGQGEAEK